MQEVTSLMLVHRYPNILRGLTLLIWALKFPPLVNTKWPCMKVLWSPFWSQADLWIRPRRTKQSQAGLNMLKSHTDINTLLYLNTRNGQMQILNIPYVSLRGMTHKEKQQNYKIVPMNSGKKTKEWITVKPVWPTNADGWEEITQKHYYGMLNCSGRHW